MEILNKKQKIILIIIVGFILLFIGYYIIKKANNSGYIELETQDNEYENDVIGNDVIEYETEIEDKDIIIHITGSIKKQGIVKVKQGSRISDVIDAAGGITDEADLSKINLAYIVQDGQKIYVPNINDKENSSNITEEAGENVIEDDNNNNGEKININTASQTELETLDGVGPSTALKIINYRNQNGNFKKIEDIKNVPGIGDAKFESMKENICIK